MYKVVRSKGVLSRGLVLAAMLSVGTGVATAQTAHVAPPLTTPVTLTLLERTRVNATQWFAATPDAERYGHVDQLVRLGLEQRIRTLDYKLEVGNSTELALPTDAVSGVAAQGQLGLGGTYFASNNSNDYPVAASLRQAFLRWRYRGATNAANTVRLGRFEFFEGQETTPRDLTLLWLQTNRIGQRLVGNFGFSNGQRSFDGVDAHLARGAWDLTAMAGRPTQGSFNMNANPELNVDTQYLAYTRSAASGRVLLRGFALGYHDGRTGLTKTDNRPAAVRAMDHRNIRLGTYGADAVAAIPLGTTTLDLLFWGALQNGSWGVQDHRAGAFATEAGLKLRAVPSQPWLRGGLWRSTGDSNPADGVHNTFFQVLPTPRLYARFPFFNLMNLRDEFVQVIDKPAKAVEVRSDLHFLQLTSGTDFWYSGGGAFDGKVFGFTGRPGARSGSLASWYDASVDYAVTKQLSLTAYYAVAWGRTVVGAIYPRDRDAQYGFLELNYRFSRAIGQAPRP